MSIRQRSLHYDRRRESVCWICCEPVNLETAKSDENGKTVHEECYAEKLLEQKAPNPQEKKAA